MRTRIIRTTAVCLLLIAFVASSAVVAKSADKPKGPEGRAKAPDLVMIEFIHWKDDVWKAKPGCNNDGICDPDENPSCPDCKGGDEEPTDPTTSCYAFIGQFGKTYLKWREPIDLVIDGDVPQSIIDGVGAGIFTWESGGDVENTKEVLPTNVFNDVDDTPGNDVSWGVADGVNAICYGDNYDNPGVIAVTRLWYNPATKSMAEFDISFETDFSWGDGAGEMDPWNIAAHELGHGLGLADIYDGQCSDVTMFGTSYPGDIEKRTLADPDIEAIQILYP